MRRRGHSTVHTCRRGLQMAPRRRLALRTLRKVPLRLADSTSCSHHLHAAHWSSVHPALCLASALLSSLPNTLGYKVPDLQLGFGSGRSNGVVAPVRDRPSSLSGLFSSLERTPNLAANVTVDERQVNPRFQTYLFHPTSISPFYSARATRLHPSALLGGALLFFGLVF